MKKITSIIILLLIVLTLSSCNKDLEIVIDDNIEVGATVTLKLNKDTTDIYWEVSDYEVGIIDSNNNLKTKSTGSLIIFATIKDKKLSKEIKVVSNPSKISKVFYENNEANNEISIYFELKNKYDYIAKTDGSININIVNDYNVDIYNDELNFSKDFFREIEHNNRTYNVNDATIKYSDIRNSGTNKATIKLKIELENDIVLTESIVVNDMFNNPFTILYNHFSSNYEKIENYYYTSENIIVKVEEDHYFEAETQNKEITIKVSDDKKIKFLIRTNDQDIHQTKIEFDISQDISSGYVTFNYDNDQVLYANATFEDGAFIFHFQSDVFKDFYERIKNDIIASRNIENALTIFNDILIDLNIDTLI